jgi:hypothetical protein
MSWIMTKILDTQSRVMKTPTVNDILGADEAVEIILDKNLQGRRALIN